MSHKTQARKSSLSFLDIKTGAGYNPSSIFYDMLVRTFFSRLLAFFFPSALGQGTVDLLSLKICIQVKKEPYKEINQNKIKPEMPAGN